jgi:glyoxylase-like metal-dependent hydrolase (beta-lactamase superfamily II)
MRTEFSGMAPIDSQELVSGVYSIKGVNYANFYIVEGDNNLIAFDCGGNKNTVSKELAILNLDPLKVEAIFFTHTDTDHVSALGLFPEASVYISAEEEQMIDGTTARTWIFKNKIPAGYKLLNDNQDIEIAGLKVHCILTPGHTPGAMSYVVNDTYLFTGDTLRLKDNKVGLFNDLFNMDTEREKVSIDKLARLPGVKYIFTAHYGYSDNYKESFADWE